MHKFPVIALLALAVSGCSILRSDYQRPELTIPATWNETAEQSAVASGEDWWRAFQDQRLDSLVEQALSRNNTLGSALLKVRRAQLQAGLARDALFPQLSSGFDAGKSRNLRGDSTTTHSYSFNSSVSWELDLWQRLASAEDAAQLEALASEGDYQAARLTLVGTLGNLYWQVAYLNERIAFSQQSVEDGERTLALVQVQYDSGKASTLELAEARQSLETLRASHQSLLQQRVEQRNALAVLFDGAIPAELDDIQGLQQAILPSVAAGLPASLLGRRPDLQAAELRLRGSLATVDATRADYYPGISLTGALGFASSSLGNVLQNPVATLGSGLTLPFLQWNRMQLNVDIAKVDYQVAAIDFRQTLYEALADVENNLAGRRHYAEQQAMRERALEAANEAERIYRVRYEAGAIDLQSWLSAQETRRNAQITLLENKRDQLLNHIALCQALGGQAE
ncbi:efflux transporter outer membrane subunit [Pseudomonas sp. ABC1]|uniref:efflux transporter outer membrane subunit n=1 Tax=Pseudomonas sp. ABC1 TaxID=2748080 RepID=UPI0015C2DEB0|nr:efflux transporter outer membrane subunit [Pseudomonas sp. ABC1]QLF92551.1 efflux transporter outer membrane subunit [Pseudomonas sp. ABC1]